MLLQLIFAWDPFVVGAMDTCEIADAAIAAASTAGTLVVCALAGTVASLCATADEEDASGNAGAQQYTYIYIQYMSCTFMSCTSIDLLTNLHTSESIYIPIHTQNTH